ncbi:MAG TPA: phosphotransferase [Micromonosporaceae bacterium]|nr:phosphotransferase [Micromonosporaceae bacterium]
MPTGPDPDAVRAAFGLASAAPATLRPAARGALGRVWRLEIGPDRYAVKEVFDDEVTERLVRYETDFTSRAAARGVRLPRSHPDPTGRFLVTLGSGRLRLYDWVDATRADLADPRTPGRLGTLLADLHLAAPRSDREPAGGAPDPWFDVPPPPEAWPPLVAASAAAGMPWAGALAAVVARLPELTALCAPTEPVRMVVCHRDLHPENVLAGPDGGFVVLDWDNLGPADPARELARVLMDWFFVDDHLDADSVGAALSAYAAAGGPARLRDLSVFGLLVASRLNFLRGQVTVALDPEAAEDDQVWAAREIDEAVTILPTPGVLTEVLAIAARVRPPSGT